MADKKQNSWAIIDSQGIIHSGSEFEMTFAMEVICNPDEHSKEDYDKWFPQAYEGNVGWVGDIMLIEIHQIYK